MDSRLLFSGYGGQGILFAGKVAATAGLLGGREVTWMPSYGPEMRGGTANCGVIISDTPIGSPIVNAPTLLVAMTGPAFDKFIGAVAPGGVVVADTALVERDNPRDDVTVAGLPDTRLAGEAGLDGLASIILLGKALALCRFATLEAVEAALEKCVPAKKAHLLAPNRTALQMGMDY